MRAFVEVDTDVRFKCLDTGLRLKEEFKNCCLIQLYVFAQEPILSKGRNCPEGMKLLEEALARDEVDVLGTSPYAEENDDRMRANVDWAILIALKYAKHLDLHLDENFDQQKRLMTEHVIEVAKAPEGVLGHCTRLTLFKAEEWHSLRITPRFFHRSPFLRSLQCIERPKQQQADARRHSLDPRNEKEIPHQRRHWR